MRFLVLTRDVPLPGSQSVSVRLHAQVLFPACFQNACCNVLLSMSATHLDSCHPSRLGTQLALAQGVCSDKSDGAAQVTEPTHSTRLNDAEKGHVSTRPGKCLEQGRTYCDGSVDS
eukprot:1545891-Rhodomonas_salina.1